mmetsp:Transcript_27357/g.72646  ORF Transcript_27357/g.72646 Transcript_27357/m.72646 type:complete len:205 (+) Transcript_27357:1163-1777(+)
MAICALDSHGMVCSHRDERAVRKSESCPLNRLIPVCIRDPDVDDSLVSGLARQAVVTQHSLPDLEGTQLLCTTAALDLRETGLGQAICSFARCLEAAHANLLAIAQTNKREDCRCSHGRAAHGDWKTRLRWLASKGLLARRDRWPFLGAELSLATLYLLNYNFSLLSLQQKHQPLMHDLLAPLDALSTEQHDERRDVLGPEPKR